MANPSFQTLRLKPWTHLWLLSFSHIPHIICQENLFALPSKYIQNQTTSLVHATRTLPVDYGILTCLSCPFFLLKYFLSMEARGILMKCSSCHVASVIKPLQWPKSLQHPTRPHTIGAPPPSLLSFPTVPLALSTSSHTGPFGAHTQDRPTLALGLQTGCSPAGILLPQTFA